MYVRWQIKRRSEKPLNVWGSDLLTATLVESRRVNGKPRQRVIAYLGSIREKCAQTPEHVNHQLGFWNSVGAKLDGLANQITPDERARIEAKLAARVRIPTPESPRKRPSKKKPVRRPKKGTKP